jgi:hypothetical protein
MIIILFLSATKSVKDSVARRIPLPVRARHRPSQMRRLDSVAVNVQLELDRSRDLQMNRICM